MTDPRVLSIISFIFALMAAYSLYTAFRQLRDARRAGRKLRWYKHLGLMTGIEYALLTFVFLLRTASEQNAIAPNMKALVGWLYLILLLPAALIAGLVIRQVLLNLRATGQARRDAAQTLSASSQAGTEAYTISKQEKDAHTRRLRERRKKAAAARRRQAGRT